jgi:hypothetical protein
MVTLDKEIAEEKCEQLESAIAQLESKCESLEQELQSLRSKKTTASTTPTAPPPVAAPTGGAEHAALIHQLQAAIVQQKEQIQSYKEQLDAHQDSASMVERLSDKVLSLEGELQEAQEQVQELTSLKDTADEMEESLVTAEREVRQQLHACQVQLLDARDREAALQQLVKELQMSILMAREEAKSEVQHALEQQQQQQQQSDSPAAAAPSAPLPRIVINNQSQLAVDSQLQQLEVQHHRRKMELLERLLPLDVVDLAQIECVLTAERARDKCGLVFQRCEQLLLNEAAPENEALAALACGRQMHAAQNALAQIGGGAGAKLPERGDIDAIEVLIDSLVQLVRVDNYLDAPPSARRVALLAGNLPLTPSAAVQTRDAIDELVYRARTRLVRAQHTEDAAVGEVRTTLETARQLQRAHTTHVLDLAPLLRGTFLTEVDEPALAKQIANLIAQVRNSDAPPAADAKTAAGALAQHIERVRGQLHATAAQQIELQELRAQLNQRKVDQLQLERQIAEKDYTCQTLQSKFDKARQSEQAAVAAVHEAQAKLDEQQRESLQALDLLRNELAQTRGANNNNSSSSDLAASMSLKASVADDGDADVSAAPSSAVTNATAINVSLESTYLLNTIHFLQQELALARVARDPLLELPPPLDVGALQRLRRPLTAQTDINTALQQVRLIAAQATVPSLTGNALQQHQLRRAQRQQITLLKRKVARLAVHGK